MSVFRDLANLYDLIKFESIDKLTEKILENVKEAIEYKRFYDLLIHGGQGTGKSSLALYIMLKHYKEPDRVLDNVFFEIDDLVMTLLREKREVILLDDAGITLSKYNPLAPETVDYYKLQQIARTRVNCIIYTTVFDNLAKFIRDIVDNAIALYKVRNYTVYGTLYSKYTKVKSITRKEFDFKFSIKELHDDEVFHKLYTEYNKMREQFVFSVIHSLMAKKRVEKAEGIDEYNRIVLSKIYGGDYHG